MTESTCGSEGPKLLQKTYEENERSDFWGVFQFRFFGGGVLGFFCLVGFLWWCLFVCPPGLPCFCVTYQGWLLGLIFVQVAAETSYLMLSNKNKNILTITEKSCRKDADFLLPNICNLLPFSLFQQNSHIEIIYYHLVKTSKSFNRSSFSDISTDNTLKTQQS